MSITWRDRRKLPREGDSEKSLDKQAEFQLVVAMVQRNGRENHKRIQEGGWLARHRQACGHWLGWRPGFQRAPFTENSPSYTLGPWRQVCAMQPWSPTKPDCSHSETCHQAAVVTSLAQEFETWMGTDSQPGICWGQITIHLEGSPQNWSVPVHPSAFQ